MANNVVFDEEILHSQYKEAFDKLDWMRVLKEDVEFVMLQLRGGYRMGSIAIFLGSFRFCDETVRMCDNDVFKILHIAIKMVKS